MLVGDEPRTGAAAHSGRGNALADDSFGQEIVGDEFLQALPQRLFAIGDDRRMRDRQAQRMTKKCSDGEPIGDRADHRGLGGGIDITPAAGLLAREDIHDRRQNQQ